MTKLYISVAFIAINAQINYSFSLKLQYFKRNPAEYSVPKQWAHGFCLPFFSYRSLWVTKYCKSYLKAPQTK